MSEINNRDKIIKNLRKITIIRKENIKMDIELVEEIYNLHIKGLYKYKLQFKYKTGISNRYEKIC